MLVLAAGGNASGGLPAWAYFVLVAAILVLVIVRQTVARPVTMRRLFVLPGVITVWGVVSLGQVFAHGVTGLDVLLLLLDVVAAVGLGLLRGVTMRVWKSDGVTYSRGRWLTLVAWLVSIAARLGLEVLAHAMGATVAANESFLPVLLGVTLLTQNLLLMVRVQRAGWVLATTDALGSRRDVAGRR
jgi:hypothetical protein